MDTSEIVPNQIKNNLLNSILSDPDLDFELIAKNLIQKGNINTTESNEILYGWRKGRDVEGTSSTEEIKPDYRTMLAYYVENYNNLDYEKIGKEYVFKGRLPQIAVDNILYRWRRGKVNKPMPNNFVEKIRQWWKLEIRNTSIFFQGFLFALISFFVGTRFLGPSVLPDMSERDKYLLFCVPFAYGVQYYVIQKFLLKDIVHKINEIRDSNYHFVSNKTFETASDEITSQNIKLLKLQFELQAASKGNYMDRIITVFVLYILVIVILLHL